MGAQVPPVPVDIVYPESDGRPMADNTKQFEWIVTIKENLDAVFPEVFVAGDLLWYPVEGNPKIRQAPDAMVVFGRPKGHRGSYLQWKEENIAPQVVFEILSPGNTYGEMVRKLEFYERYGVEEYYVYDPDHNELNGWQRQEGRFQTIAAIDDWTSPRLKIRFERTPESLKLYRPDGTLFETFAELLVRAEADRQRAETLQREKDQTQAKLERLAARLRELGEDPDLP
ncbi:MAG TPA: Uma2 family endonuclease [Acidobacteriota bacterium]|nr:Uma2 family endonuclease [Acidobacteriota bacterium]HNB73171.1 Uma2 family endonuclease [Acidobacteriota bacterium]HNH82560.1 Uma2 family endonuclease [Acidobacteriota bacterium]